MHRKKYDPTSLSNISAISWRELIVLLNKILRNKTSNILVYKTIELYVQIKET
jgi:hypothetical protein